MLALATKKNKELVIDASILRAAGGEEATHPVSTNCRDFLGRVLIICHHVPTTLLIRKEWKKHESNFAVGWWKSMTARKKINYLEESNYDDFVEVIKRNIPMGGKLTEVLKDADLVFAALISGKNIASLDDNARDIYKQISNSVADIKGITWVNPISEVSATFEWLRNGLPEKEEWKLGFINDSL